MHITDSCRTTAGAVGVILVCSGALTACMSDPAGEEFTLAGGTTVQVQPPSGWQAREADGTVLLTPKGDDRDLAGLTDALTSAQLGSSSRGANFLTIAAVGRCGGDGSWLWSTTVRTSSGVQSGEVRGKAGDRCVAVHASYAQGGGDDSANGAETGPPSVDLLGKVVDGDIVSID